MKKIIFLLLVLLSILSCKNDTISKADKEKVTELNNKAVELRFKGELDKAEKLYEEALEIDNTDVNIHYMLVGIYVQKKEFNKAFKLLEKLPKDQKKSLQYYQIKGGIFEFNGDLKSAKENYSKAYELSEVKEVKTESDLNELIEYAGIETLAGYKEKAVDRINEALQLDWLTESNKESLRVFRNEFEFYQGKGVQGFDRENPITLCTTNIDSLKNVLKQHHINVLGSSFAVGENEIEGKQAGEIRVDEKFQSGIDKLGLEECDSK
ncbi:tetratricopeptide repeat protein [Kordia sp.]|uniref:tetratricopeptide repeat protein n=1 Tax=Kordia sp. TaxID=1965332 RepID=UPI003D2E4043